MAKITTVKGTKKKGDKIVLVDNHKITHDEYCEQVKHKVDELGEEKVRAHLGLQKAKYKHRKNPLPDLSLDELKKIKKEFENIEEINYPSSKGKQGADMIRKKISREIHRHVSRKKSNNS